MAWFKTTSRETETLPSAVATYIVKWSSYGGSLMDYPDRKTNQQAFTNLDEAKKFKASLEQAFKLIGQTIAADVEIYQQQAGL